MVDPSSSLGKSLEEQPLKPDSELSLSSSLTVIRPEHQQEDSSSDPPTTQLPPTTPGTAPTQPPHSHSHSHSHSQSHSHSLEPGSPPPVVDGPPSPTIVAEDVSDPTPGLAADIIQSVDPSPSLPSVPPIHPPTPFDTLPHSTATQPDQQTAEHSEPAAVSPSPQPQEDQARLSSSPQPVTTSTTTPPSPPAAPASTTTTTTTATVTTSTTIPTTIPVVVAAAEDTLTECATTTATTTITTAPAPAPPPPPTTASPPPTSSPPATLHQKDLPTLPVSDCSPPQLDNISCQPDPPQSPLPLTDPSVLDQPTGLPEQTAVPSTTTVAPPSPQHPLVAVSPAYSHSTERPGPHPRVVSHQSPRPLPVSDSASINSLSPLSEVPSAHSPGHLIESPITQSHSALSPQPSPVSAKRQASPFAYENGTHSGQGPQGSATHLNGSRVEANGQSAPKRPRLAHESSPNPSTNSASFNPPSHPFTAPPHSHQTLPSQSAPAPARNPPQTMTEQTGLVPGHPGTRLTKDQHRFAISVTKQLKKHRSANPFLLPVDPVLLNIPDYFDVITHPMDLTTIETRLGKVGKPCYYRSVQDFVSDVQLVFSNCFTYNGPPHASLYSRMAADLSIQFETQMKKMPLDEPISYPPATRSPSIAKPPPKSKPPAETRPLPSAAKRKNVSPIGHASSLPTGQTSTSQKRRSISPQHPRKKTSKATSLSSSALPDGNVAHPESSWHPAAAWGVDPSSSQRPKAEVAQHYATNQYATELPMISNAKAELKFCKDVLREVNKKVYEKFVWPFYEPVDIVKLGIPDYPKYVKRPMDLETMKNKLARDDYQNGAAFAEDFRLMLKNCYAFNPPSSTYYHCGKQLESLFEAKWAERPPAEIPAPTPAPAAAAPAVVPPVLDPIQQLQIQVAALQERLDVETSKKGRHNSTHVIPGTGPPKKQSQARATAQSKNLTSATAGTLLPGSATSAHPKSGKANPTAPAKPKSTSAARRKSAGTTLAPAAKRQSQSFEPPTLDRQPDYPEQAFQPYQTTPAGNTFLPPEPAAASPPAVNRRFSQHDDYCEEIDYEQKKDLATQIQNAVEPMQSDAINLIRTSRPDLVPVSGEEIELDIDALDPRTLYQLYQLVCAPAPPQPTKGKKAPKGGVTNGKPKARRKPAPSAARKPPATAVAPYPAAALPQAPVLHQEAEAAHAWSNPGPQVPNGNGNGTKPKANKKPRSSAPGPRRKGIDEIQEAARIKELEEKLHEFEGYTDPQPNHQMNHPNGAPPSNQTLEPALNMPPPPAGPVEYASSSSESESESDDDSD